MCNLYPTTETLPLAPEEVRAYPSLSFTTDKVLKPPYLAFYKKKEKVNQLDDAFPILTFSGYYQLFCGIFSSC